MAAEDSLVRALNRRVRRPNAKLSFEGDKPFGASLRLRSFRLGNGLDILLVADRSAPVISFHTWYRVGSRDEVVGKTGLAHMLEHLMFGGTSAREAGEFDRLCEQAGAEANAATWTDWTYYYENLPKASLGLAMELEADRMVGLELKAKPFASEREVVENERRYRVDDDVEGSASELLYELAFRDHPYRWPTIGWLDDIRGYRLGDVRRFYKRWYAPNNAAIVLVGDFKEADVLALVQDRYGALEPSRLPKRARPVEAPQKRARARTLRKPTSTEKFQLGFHAPALGTPDYAALVVLSEILLGGRSSRIHKRLVHDLELASEARGGLAPFGDPGLFDLFVSMRSGHSVDEGLRVVAEELDVVRRAPVRDDELEKAKNRLELGFLEGMEGASGKAEQIGFYHTVLGDTDGVFGHLEDYRRVDAAAVQDAAKRYLAPSKQNLIRILPDGKDAS